MLNPADGLDPVNRRITIVVLNKQTEQAVLHEGVELSTSTSTPLEPVAIKEASVK
jgi:hypothetical protein